DFWVSENGIPLSIVSDRDSRFTSQNWQELMRLYGSKLLISSGRHPETNGQTEQMNKILQQVLRMYIRPDQINWDEMLPKVASAYNNSVHLSTCRTPNELHKSFRPHRPFEGLNRDHIHRLPPGTREFAIEHEKELATVVENLRKAQHRMIQQANKHRRPSQFQVGDLVWVKAKEFAPEENISQKLLPAYRGPWPVLEVKGGEDGPSYSIEIPAHLHTYPVFHASKLLPCVTSQQFPSRRSMIPPDMDGSYDIEGIVEEDVFRTGGRGRPQKQYKVRFAYQEPEDDRWFTKVELLETAPDIVRAYERDKKGPLAPLADLPSRPHSPVGQCSAPTATPELAATLMARGAPPSQVALDGPLPPAPAFSESNEEENVEKRPLTRARRVSRHLRLDLPSPGILEQSRDAGGHGSMGVGGDDVVGEDPPTGGPEGSMPSHAQDLLHDMVELFIEALHLRDTRTTSERFPMGAKDLQGEYDQSMAMDDSRTREIERQMDEQRRKEIGSNPSVMVGCDGEDEITLSVAGHEAEGGGTGMAEDRPCDAPTPTREEDPQTPHRPFFKVGYGCRGEVALSKPSTLHVAWGLMRRGDAHCAAPCYLGSGMAVHVPLAPQATDHPFVVDELAASDVHDVIGLDNHVL
ncbi:hypothetical protein CBR_g21214, partial [Chara braunii]